MSVAIVKRYTTEEGVAMRELECGHKVPEPRGGKARWALFVRTCIVCKEMAAARLEERSARLAGADGRVTFGSIKAFMDRVKNRS